MSETPAKYGGGELRQAIVRIRGTPMILDADLARAYGVTTKALNQAVKRNAERFPADFIFQLTVGEFSTLKDAGEVSGDGRAALRSQIVILKIQSLQA